MKTYSRLYIRINNRDRDTSTAKPQKSNKTGKVYLTWIGLMLLQKQAFVVWLLLFCVFASADDSQEKFNWKKKRTWTARLGSFEKQGYLWGLDNGTAVLKYSSKKGPATKKIKYNNLSVKDLNFILVAIIKDESLPFDEIDSLVDAGADVETPTGTHGNTPLMQCTTSKQPIWRLKKLIELGANVNAENKSHFTALSFAILQRNDEIMNFLKSEGATFTDAQRGAMQELISDLKELNEAQQEVDRQKKAEAKERLDFDPVLQGIWKLHATSDDKGKTRKEHDGQAFCKVTATTVKMIDRKEMTADTIRIVEINDAPGNFVKFRNGTMWAISKPADQELVLVQVFTTKTGELDETFRFIVTVHK